ncbi:hypothetical protein RRG08_018985 [Elysia crispata]|uniref:Uncharacterized protein n=1 Tax=Elysia crispata TaxID=231223 RepID=A0AAE1A4V0_9GAST|nr:hypothetical protein RRG08_018985 [Elysia crispata]
MLASTEILRFPCQELRAEWGLAAQVLESVRNERILIRIIDGAEGRVSHGEEGRDGGENRKDKGIVGGESYGGKGDAEEGAKDDEGEKQR